MEMLLTVVLNAAAIYSENNPNSDKWLLLFQHEYLINRYIVTMKDI